MRYHYLPIVKLEFLLCNHAHFFLLVRYGSEIKGLLRLFLRSWLNLVILDLFFDIGLFLVHLRFRLSVRRVKVFLFFLLILQEVAIVEFSIHALLLIVVLVIKPLLLDLPLELLQLPGLTPDLILKLDVPKLSLGLAHPIMLHAYLLSQIPYVLVELELLLKLDLPLIQLLHHLLLVLLEPLDLLEASRSHLIPPQWISLVQVPQELPLGLLELVLRAVQRLVPLCRLEGLLHLLQQALVSQLVSQPLLLHPVELLLNLLCTDVIVHPLILLPLVYLLL